MEQLKNFRLTEGVANLKLNKLLYVTQDMDGYWKAFETPPKYVIDIWYRRDDSDYMCMFGKSETTEVATQKQLLQIVFPE